jgi:uncharacterized spore protein YtfJ
VPKYKLKYGSHTVGGLRYKAGVKDSDILDLTEKQAKQFEEGRLIPIGGSLSSDSSVTPEAEVSIILVDKDSIKLLDSNDINLITQTISTVNDLTLLETLYNHEESNKNRKEVLESINKQYESLGSADVSVSAATAKKVKK